MAIILIGIIGYCTYLLLYKLGLQSLWIDEGYSSYVAKYMTLNGLYKSKYFLFEWLQVLSFKIGGFSDFWARIPNVLTHIGSILLMYFIPSKLCKNKHIGLFAALIFGLLYWEIGRGRDARFYSLLQFLFLGGLSAIIQWMETKKTIYLNITIIITCLGVIFHPFLYILGAILFFTAIQQYKKSRDFKNLFSKKFLSTWILIGLLIIAAICFGTIGNQLSGSLLGDKPTRYIRHYFNSYNNHLRDQLGIVYALGLLGMIRAIIKAIVKKEYKLLILFFCPFVLFAYAIVIKGYLLHYRYALLLFPIIILCASVSVFEIISLIKNKYVGAIIMIGILGGICYTANLQFTPISHYYFDYTSPQPDFKSAYKSIPDGQNVISGFPTLCDWYYSDRGDCQYAIRVDLVHDGKIEKLLKRTGDNYTKIPYINDINSLGKGTYYFVIDNLTSKSKKINSTLYSQIYQYGEITFEDGSGYNNIKIFRLGK